MTDFRVGYLYSFSPIHCGGEGDIGNILEIAREVHTNFPYIPGSSLRGSLRNEVLRCSTQDITNRLFGKELENGSQMGIHQVWFGDARLLWIPMRTMSRQGSDVFIWVSCHSLIRDHALLTRQAMVDLPDYAIGDRSGTYTVADAEIQVTTFTAEQQQVITLAGNWHSDLQSATKSTWERSRILLPDADFQVLMEHSLWTQIRNKIQESGSAEVFWTDVCIPRDTILYYAWGYNILKSNSVTPDDHNILKSVLTGLLQVGGQANVGRGWVQSWIANNTSPVNSVQENPIAVEA